MAIDFSNYINTYKGSSVLQQQFPNMNDYLALFGFGGQQTLPVQPTNPNDPIKPEEGIQNIIGQDLRSGAGSAGIPSIGSGAGQGSGLIGDFMTATQERQNRLTNPNNVQSFINQFTGGGQRDIGEMIRTGQVDTRASAGLPLGIGAGIAMMLPDNYYNMSLGDQIFTQSQMGYTGPTVFGENTTGGAKDPFGLNVRSAFGNYAEAVGKDFASLSESLSGRLADKYGVEFDEETGMFVGANAAQANKMTKMMRTRFNFRKQQLDAKNRLDAQVKAAEEKRKKEEAAAKQKAAQQTASLSQLTTGQGGGRGIASEGVRSGRVDAAGMGGGSRQAKSSGAQKTGRTDGGWGWKEGGSVMSEKEMKKLSETPLYKGFKKMYSVDSSMAKDNPAYSKKYKVFEELYKKGYQKGGLATMFKLKG